jgi:hypothetical protein
MSKVDQEAEVEEQQQQSAPPELLSELHQFMADYKDTFIKIVKGINAKNAAKLQKLREEKDRELEVLKQQLLAGRREEVERELREELRPVIRRELVEDPKINNEARGIAAAQMVKTMRRMKPDLQKILKELE